MRFYWLRLVLIVAAFAAVAAQHADGSTINLNLSTGLNSTGVVQSTSGAADANWIVNSQSAKVLTSSSSDWWGFWPSDDTKSSWIAKDSTTVSGNGVGTYSRIFDLTGIDLNSVNFSGNWAVDDEGTLALNGHQIGAYQPHDGWQNFATQTFSVINPSWFNQGSNSLVLTIAAADNFFEGVRLNGVLVGSTPEPTSLALLGGGLSGLFLRRRNTRPAIFQVAGQLTS